MIIGLSGYAQTGKDTAAGFMAPLGFERLAFADPLKQVALEINPYIDAYRHRLGDIVGPNGWEFAKRLPEVRSLLQRLGVSVREHVDSDAWVKATMRKAHPGGRYVITDVRFPNEAKAITFRGGYIVRVTRPGVDAVNAHVSETAMDDWPFDAHLVNDADLATFATRVNRLVLGLGLEVGR